MEPPSRYELVDFAALPGVPCPCGTARRAFAELGDFPATVHVTSIDRTAQTHFHNRTTEVYYILECEPGAIMELDADAVPLRPGMCILIRPGIRHRAVGKLKVLITAWPKFTVDDEVVVAGEQGSRGAGEQGSRGAGEQGSRGAGEQGSRGAGEQGSRGAGEQE